MTSKIGILAAVTLSLFLACATPATASEAGPGIVSDLQIDGNRILFAMSGTRTTKPGCAIWDRFVFDITSANGPAMLAYLLSAQATGKQVRVYGSSTCTVLPDSENAYSLRDG
jgi:hypothetical protein